MFFARLKEVPSNARLVGYRQNTTEKRWRTLRHSTIFVYGIGFPEIRQIVLCRFQSPVRVPPEAKLNSLVIYYVVESPYTFSSLYIQDNVQRGFIN